MSAKQWVKLSGLGLDAFDQCATAILEIQQVLSTHLPASALQPWAPKVERGCMTIEFSNRYFSDQEIADEEEVIGDTIDPLHLLRNRMPSQARHTKDNGVLYYERRGAKGYVDHTITHCRLTFHTGRTST